MAAMVKKAPIKWAQRKDSVYLTISLADVKDHKIEVTDTNMTFSGTSNAVPYEVSIEFFKEVDAKAEGSVWNVLPQSVQMKIMKKDQEAEEFWPRLLKDKILEKNTVTIDWDRYVDEDEGDEDFNMDAMGGGQGFGGGGMPGMGGMGGMGGGMPGMEGMDIQKMMAQMQAGGGMPGMDGADAGAGAEEADSDDDEELPDLEEAA